MEICDEAASYEVEKEVGRFVKSLDTGPPVLSDVAMFVLEDRVVRLDPGRLSIADAVTVTVVTGTVGLLDLELIGASVGHAVCGPNFLIK